MTRSAITTILFCIAAFSAYGKPAFAEEESIGPVFELRTYYANEGKIDDLLSRFRDHTCELFTKHNIKNIAYFVTEGKQNKRLIYFVNYESQEARNKSWIAFLKDPKWIAVFKASRKDGPLINKVESKFLTLTDYSPKFPGKSQAENRLFELRTYTAKLDTLAPLHERFRSHTVKLFEKHGITNIAYFKPMNGEEGRSNTLVYLIAHKNKEARNKSFADFSKDPAWKTARKQSEVEAEGSLTVKGGVKKIFIQPTDFSLLK